MAKGTDFDREMTKLEAEIKRLEVEYNMFFAGRLPRLPWETRARVEQMVKKYDRMNLSNTAQRFRFGTVQARFMSFCELWERNLRAKEEGRGSRGRIAAAGSTSAAPDAAASPETSDGGETAVVPEPSAGPAIVASPEVVSRDAIEPPPMAALANHPPVRKVAMPPLETAAPVDPPRAPARTAIETTRIGDIGRDSDRVSALYDELTRARRETGEAPMPFDKFATVVRAQVAKLGGSGKDVAFRVSVSQGKVTLQAKKIDE